MTSDGHSVLCSDLAHPVVLKFVELINDNSTSERDFVVITREIQYSEVFIILALIIYIIC
jgi:hypothetical protein